MISQISNIESIVKALTYNQNKVDNKAACILGVNKIALPLYDTENLSYYFYKYFEPYLINNLKTVAPARHISLNPNPVDRINDITLLNIAKTYMEKMGYQNQPYIVYKHFDIQRVHLHIVSVAVDLHGFKIEKEFDFALAKKVCLELTKQYNLTGYEKKHKNNNDLNLVVVDYRKPNVIKQVDNVVSSLPKYYSFDDFDSYNAILELFKVKARFGKNTEFNSIMYFALDNQNKEISNIVSSSKLSLKVDINFLNNHFKESSNNRDPLIANEVKTYINSYLVQSKDYKHFKKLLTNQGINLVSDNAVKNKFYFVSHKHRRVFCFSDIDAQLSHRLENNPFFNPQLENTKKKNDPLQELIQYRYDELNKEFESLRVHPSFDFVDNYYNAYNKVEFICFFNFLFNTPADDLSHQHLENLKKKKKRKKKELGISLT
ncbi:relaxase/mobilization nuclease domain-containing protein [Myroides odoratimimus]|uniref:relaxase/mobilization nuclease domain-containing protein n=1 Tax=Myroides odoratimimus TaxID=76832 RepID=UPI001CE0E64A|nr:relaxase/mobilization nuclease domain-containing protein [Myroides odoratimimus]MCA4806997.1 relaxase/mobilization nuclease domain-containing protein [Myroides odoratimimus]